MKEIKGNICLILVLMLGLHSNLKKKNKNKTKQKYRPLGSKKYLIYLTVFQEYMDKESQIIFK